MLTAANPRLNVSKNVRNRENRISIHHSDALKQKELLYTR